MSPGEVPAFIPVTDFYKPTVDSLKDTAVLDIHKPVSVLSPKIVSPHDLTIKNPDTFSRHESSGRPVQWPA